MHSTIALGFKADHLVEKYRFFFLWSFFCSFPPKITATLTSADLRDKFWELNCAIFVIANTQL